MSIFSTLGKFGLESYNASNILDDTKSSDVPGQDSQDNNVKSPEELEEEALFDKTYECPICNLVFKSKCVRAGKARLIDKDTDLRPIYEHIDPVKYEVVTCDKCGYSALSRYWGKLSMRQIKDINGQIGAKFSGMESAVRKKIYTYDDAIVRYELALVTTIVKKARNSERAYTCLKYAWTLRGKRLLLQSDGADTEEIESLYKDEQECLTNAYEGFVKAISNEMYPIAGMDENTLNYVLADIARRIGREEEALRFLGTVLTSRNAASRIKNEALKLKDMIRADQKKKNEKGV